jgi:predicted transcriptional regulator
MAERGLIVETDEGYMITSRGFEWLRLYQLLREIYDPPALA